MLIDWCKVDLHIFDKNLLQVSKVFLIIFNKIRNEIYLKLTNLIILIISWLLSINNLIDKLKSTMDFDSRYKNWILN